MLPSVRLGERKSADEVSALPVGDELAATCTAALLHALTTKKVAVARRATQELTGARLLEALGDGFACFLHVKNWESRGKHSFRGSL